MSMQDMSDRSSVFLALLFLAIVAGLAAGAENTGNRAAGAKTAPKAKSPPDAKKSSGEKTAPDLDLNGVWRGFVVEGKGEQPNRGSVHLQLTIVGNRIAAQRLDGQGGSLGQGVYQIATERFYLMDATEVRARGKGRTYLGICKFGPDLMKWCVATPGNKRPADFETKGSQFLLILKRQR
jgi:hypothetical protein